MKILKYIFLFLLLIIVAAAIYIATLESTYDVSRSKVVKAPVQVVYNNVSDFKNWKAWSPWLEKDPEGVLTYGNITKGKGGTYSWKGEVVGEGGMETLEVVANESISQKIEFIKPFESNSDIYWNFKPVDGGTEVTWGMKGELDFIARAYMAFSGGMDKNIGPDYERGLFRLDSVVQVDMKKYSIKVEGVTTHGGGFYLYNSTSCKIEEVSSKIQEMMPKVGLYAQKNKIKMAGSPFVIRYLYDEENNAVMFFCAVPVAERVITESGSGILTGMLPPFKALKTTLKGNYVNLNEAWNTTKKYMDNNQLEEPKGEPSLEVYSTDPMSTPNPADWVTEIYIPIKE